LTSFVVALSAVAALLMWQIQETLRRGLTADMRFRDALWGDAISYLGQAVLIIALARINQLTLMRALLIMAGTSAAATMIQAMQIGLVRIKIREINEIAADFWKLGRWMLLTNASGVITHLGYSYALLYYHGRDANAIFGAVGQAFKLANPIMSSMSGLIMPAVARAAATRGMAAATRSALRYSALGAVMLAPYLILLLIFAEPILRFLSKGEKPYHLYADLLRIFVINHVVLFFLAMSNAWLGGLGRSRYTFYAQLMNMAGSLLISVPLTAAWGVKGVIVGGGISSVLSAVAYAFLIRRSIREPLPAISGPPMDSAPPA
jgi:Na+-driven multidrug efflux pump